MTERRHANSVVRWRSAYVSRLAGGLLVALGLGPLGCGTLVGHGLGSAIDGNRFEKLNGPFSESLPSAVGRGVRVKTLDNHTVTGKLLGLGTRLEGEEVCYIESVGRTRLPGPEARIDTLAVAAVGSGEVEAHGARCELIGTFLGIAVDVTAILFVLNAYSGLRRGLAD
jgi:hypothetical protein